MHEVLRIEYQVDAKMWLPGYSSFNEWSSIPSISVTSMKRGRPRKTPITPQVYKKAKKKAANTRSACPLDFADPFQNGAFTQEMEERMNAARPLDVLDDDWTMPPFHLFRDKHNKYRCFFCKLTFSSQGAHAVHVQSSRKRIIENQKQHRAGVPNPIIVSAPEVSNQNDGINEAERGVSIAQSELGPLISHRDVAPGNNDSDPEHTSIESSESTVIHDLIDDATEAELQDQLTKFTRSLDIVERMSITHRLLGHRNIPVDTNELLKQVGILVELSECISSGAINVKYVVKNESKLMNCVPADEAIKLKKSLDAIQCRYGELTNTFFELLKGYQSALPIVQKFHDAHDRLVEWMNGATGDSLMMSDFNEMRAVLECVKSVGSQLSEMSPGEGALSIQNFVKDDNRRFDAIVDQIQHEARRTCTHDYISELTGVENFGSNLSLPQMESPVRKDIAIVVDSNTVLRHISDIQRLIGQGTKDEVTVIVPYVVHLEIDSLNKSKDMHVSFLAREANRFIETVIQEKNPNILFQDAIHDGIRHIRIDDPDDRIVNCCLQVKRHYGGNTFCISYDLNLRNKLNVNGINSYPPSAFAKFK